MERLKVGSLDRNEYKKAVSEAIAVEKLQKMYDDSGRVFEKNYQSYKNMYSDAAMKDPKMDKMLSLRSPKQIGAYIDHSISVSDELGREKYNPGLSFNGFMKTYKDKNVSDMSKREFGEMIQDTKKLLQEDISKMSGKPIGNDTMEKIAMLIAEL